jgi:hypothetical protein
MLLRKRARSTIAPGMSASFHVQRSRCQGRGKYVPDFRTPRGEQQLRTPTLDWRTPAGPHRHADGTFAADVLRLKYQNHETLHSVYLLRTGLTDLELSDQRPRQ